MHFSSLHVQLFQDVDHFERAQCRLCTLVTRLGTGTLDGLFNVFSGQYAEGNRISYSIITWAMPLLFSFATRSK